VIDFLKLLAAEGTKQIDPGTIGVPKVTDANSVLNGILNIAYAGAGILCVIIIIFAGYIYVTSDGNPANIKTAKNAIIGSVTGLIVVIAAFTATQFIIGRF
jgi:hypothetical protein